MASSEEKINKASKQLFSTEHQQEETKLAMAPYLNSEEMLSPAPMCIALLGHMLLLTHNSDCSLEKEGHVYKHIKYPSSLRASIVQVVNMGWKAFQVADKRMDQIKIYSSQIPQNLKDAITCIVKGSKSEVKLLLPGILKTVETIADSCLECSMNTEKEFEGVSELLNELMEACCRAEGEQSEKEKEVKSKEEVFTELKTKAEETEIEIKREREELFKKSDKALMKCREAVKSMPGMGKLVAISILESLTHWFGVPRMSKWLVSERDQTKENRETSNSSEDDFSTLLNTTSTCVSKLCEITDKMNQSNDNEENERHLTELIAYFEISSSSLPTGDKEQKHKLEKILKKGVELSRQLKHEIHSVSKTPETFTRLKKEADVIRGKLQAVQLGFQRNNGPIGTSLPFPRMRTEGADGITEAYIQQSYFKVEQEKERWQQLKLEMEKKTSKMEKNRANMINIMRELEKTRIDKIDFARIKQVLRKVLRALNDVAMQWKNLVEFFGRVTNMIKCSLHLSTTSLQTKIESLAQLCLEESLTDCTVNAIYSQVSYVISFSLLITHVAELYIEISSAYLLRPMSNLGELLALDSEKDADEIKAKQSELTRNAQEASEAINSRIAKHRQMYEIQIADRFEKINKEFKSLLPAKCLEDPRIAEEKNAEMEKATKELPQQEDDDEY